MAEVTTPIQDRSVERQRMVAFQVARRGVTDPRVLEAMRQVPREAFVGAGMEEFAYEDTPLPIGAGQTISQPYIVALMIEAAQIKPGDCVLDVGTGSGYAAAILSRLAGRVFSVERHRELADTARRALNKLQYTNVEVRHGDGTWDGPMRRPSMLSWSPQGVLKFLKHCGASSRSGGVLSFRSVKLAPSRNW
jgi:protein-L-isoaspartate(D-aspartate) O-methyltransferase